jgi:hypothetical protein
VIFFGGPTQALSQLRRIEPRLAHRAVDFKLCGRQGGQPHYRPSLRRRRSRNLLVVGDHAEDRLIKHVFGLEQRLVPGSAVGRTVSNVGEGHGETAIGLRFKEGGITCDISPPCLVVPAKAGTQGRRSESGR